MYYRIIIWDVDGVLINVEESYRQAIIDSIQYYFSECVGVRIDKQLMSKENIQGFKRAGGFNDDWELAYAATLCYLSELLNNNSIRKPTHPIKPGDIDEMLKALNELGSGCKNNSINLDLKPIIEKIKEQGGGMSSAESVLHKIYGKNMETAKCFWFTELIKRIFEEIYLGKKLFHKKYNEKPRFYIDEGLILKENALVDLATLLELRKKYYIGIVTGRERFETEFSLKRFNLSRVFPPELIVTREDTIEHKPSPQPLLECKKRICKKYRLHENTETIYIGDSVDDLASAKNAGFFFIGILGGVTNIEQRNALRIELLKGGCNLIVDDAEELFLYL